MYAMTNGIIRDTTDIVLRVNSLEQLFEIVRELWRSAVDG